MPWRYLGLGLAAGLLVLMATACGSAEVKPVEIQVEYGPRGAVVGEVVSFSAVNMPFKPGEVHYFKWFFGDEQMAEGERASHSYQAAGQYAVVLQIGLGADVPVNMKALGAYQRVQADGQQLVIFRKEISIGN